MTPEQVEQARELRKLGLSYRKIGEILGYCHHTIHAWLDPEIAERQRGNKRRWMVNPENRKRVNWQWRERKRRNE